ncbi:MAG: hypothetical protein PVJ07_08610, partial [Anaerolineales bacterium]
MKLRRADVFGLLLALVAVLASAWVSSNIYERLPHLEDEIANLWQAEVMAEGKLHLASPPEPWSFMVPFVVDYQGLRFAKYPPAWSAALSLGVRAGAPWLVNPILAGFSVWLIYGLGRKIAGEGVGLLAALLSVTSPMFLMLFGSLLCHGLSLFLALAFTHAWIDLFPSRRRQEQIHKKSPAWLLVMVAGLSLGLLALTRPLTALGIGMPFAVHGLILLIRGPSGARKRALAVAGITVAMASLLPLWHAAVTGDPWLNPYTLWWSYDKVGFGPGVGRNEGGHSLSIALINTHANLRAGVHDLFGWTHLSWLFLPFGMWALRRSRDGLMTLSAFPSLVLLYMAYWVGFWLLGPRYYFEALPGLAITSAAGIAWLGAWMGSRRGFRWRRPLAIAVLAILLVMNLFFYL